MKFNIYHKIIILLLFNIAWLYPFHYAPWHTAENEFFILLIPCLLLFPITQYKKLKLKLKVNELIFIPIFIIFISIIHFTFVDGYFLENLILISIYSIFIIILIFYSYIYSNEKNIYFLLKVIITTGFFNGLIIVLQKLDYQSIFILEHYGNKRFYANIGQPNHISTLFLIGIASSLILFKKNMISKIMFLAIASIFTYFIFLTGSRTGFLTLLLFLLWSLFFEKDKIRSNISIFAYLIVFYIFLSMVFSQNSRNKINTVADTANDSRLSLWSDSVGSIITKPFIGYGINGVRGSRLYSNLDFINPYTSSHNFILDSMLWFGCFGGLILIVYIFRVVLKAIISRDYNGYIILFLIPFSLHSLLEYPFRYLYFLVIIISPLCLIKSLKVYEVGRNVFIVLTIFHIGLVFLLYYEFNQYSRGAYFASIQKCEAQNSSNPLVLDLMYQYSRLYCNDLLDFEMKQVIYHYLYPIHVEHYIKSGYTDMKLEVFYKRNE